MSNPQLFPDGTSMFAVVILGLLEQIRWMNIKNKKVSILEENKLQSRF